MHRPIRLASVIQPVPHSVSRSPLRGAFLLVALALAFFALSQTVEAGLGPADTAYGIDALFSEAGGNLNSAFGIFALYSNTSGVDNTAIGADALLNNTTGSANTAIGSNALVSNKTGGANAALGAYALSRNTTGIYNTATGASALLSNTTGNYNTANGGIALQSNTTGVYNTANGYGALAQNAGGNANTATGFNALKGKTDATPSPTPRSPAGTVVGLPGSSGNYNTADGFNALANNTGNYNMADGLNALFHNTTGDANTANGVSALFNNTTGKTNTAIGSLALENSTTGDSNIALGFNAGSNLTTGSNNIDIGNVGIADESSAIRIGTAAVQTVTVIAGIRGVTTANANAVPVVIDSAGQLGTISSSARFKDQIEPMDKNSEAVLGLKPVTFHYKSDRQNTPQFGLIAEEVAKVNPDLVARDDKGEIYTVRYDAVNAMLLNEFLKEHRKVEEQERNAQEQQSTITALKGAVAKQQTQIEALTAGLQKVSARIESAKPASRMASGR